MHLKRSTVASSDLYAGRPMFELQLLTLLFEGKNPALMKTDDG